jgi:hypothetical protein
MPALVTNGIPLLTALPFALAFTWLAVGLGRRVLRLLGASEGDARERCVAALALGAGVLVWVPLALGAFGALGVTSIRVAVAALVVPLVPDLVAAARGDQGVTAPGS